jgi:hypothetical protein
MRFEVKLGNEIVGYTELERGDPPMGCAGGRFQPTAAYSAIQPHCIEHRDKWVEIPDLSISTREGICLECGVVIFDYSPELGETGVEVEAIGITKPPYAELFPHHIEAYRKQFESKPSIG